MLNSYCRPGTSQSTVCYGRAGIDAASDKIQAQCCHTLKHTPFPVSHCEVISIIAAMLQTFISSHSLSNVLQDNTDKIQLFNSVANFYLEVFLELFCYLWTTCKLNGCFLLFRCFFPDAAHERPHWTQFSSPTQLAASGEWAGTIVRHSSVPLRWCQVFSPSLPAGAWVLLVT